MVRLRCSRRLHAYYWMGLAADRPTLYRTKGPCSFRNPPSTALSRGPRGLHHARSPGVLILERSDRVPYIRLPHARPRVNPSPSSGESYKLDHRLKLSPVLCTIRICGRTGRAARFMRARATTKAGSPARARVTMTTMTTGVAAAGMAADVAPMAKFLEGFRKAGLQ